MQLLQVFGAIRDDVDDGQRQHDARSQGAQNERGGVRWVSEALRMAS